jgi:hypothetical protein
MPTARPIERIIIECPKCGQKVRVPVFAGKKLSVKCPNGCADFTFDAGHYLYTKRLAERLPRAVIGGLLAAAALLPVVAVAGFRIYTSREAHSFEAEVKGVETGNAKEIDSLRQNYAAELANVNKAALRKAADAHYGEIWLQRKNFDRRYAVSPREIAQLEMLSLASDRSRPINEIIRAIAIKASPRNSNVRVTTQGGQTRLDIDFEMSELTAGEAGSRTKHSTLASLKDEVVRLISKVTNDAFQFCQDLDLETVAIGCRHGVNEAGIRNSLIIYKVTLDKRDIRELKHNPFLDAYSTTKYFRVEHDEFPNLSIEITSFPER